MTTVYPGAIDALTNPTATDKTDAPSHAAQHANANDAIEAIETALGINVDVRLTLADSKLRFVPTTLTQIVGGSAPATIGLTESAAIVVPGGTVAVSVQVRASTSGTLSDANIVSARHHTSGAQAVFAYAPPSLNYFNMSGGIVELSSDKKIKYTVANGAGTVNYNIYMTGYWTTS